jgi:tetratricopeptide (TPR) repeat protein
LFKNPGQSVARTVSNGVGLVDVAPTILDAVRLRVPAAMQGESLLDFMKSGNTPTSNQASDPKSRRPVYSESDYGHRSFGWSPLQAWRSGKYLYVEAPERELFDQSVDPLATENLAADSKAIVETAASLLAEFYRSTAEGKTPPTNLSPGQRASLQALGYLSPDFGSSSKASTERGPDPKQRIAVANLLYGALVKLEREQYAEAVPILEQVLKQEPNAPIALLHLGRAYMAIKEYQKALAPLQSLVEEKPEDIFARYELGCALVKTGHWDEALPHFEAAVSQLSGSVMMHFYLAMVYQRNARSSDAESEFRAALSLDPNHFPANLLLGRLFVTEHKAAKALPYLRRAAKLRPDAIDAHRFLGDAYEQLGQTANAQREMAEANRLVALGASRLGTPTEARRAAPE